MEQFSQVINFPLNLVFTPADKVSVSRGVRVATKARKGQEKADFQPYVASLPETFDSISDPILRAAFSAGFVSVIGEAMKADAIVGKFKSAGFSGSDVLIELGEVEFAKLCADAISLDRATGRKLTSEEIKAAVRDLRDGFYKLVADKKNCSVSSLDDSIVRRLQVDLQKIESAMVSYAAAAYRPGTPEEAERHIKMLDAIGSAAQVLNKDAGECFPMIQTRILRYLESIAEAAEDDDEESALF